MSKKQICPTCGKSFSYGQLEPLPYFPFCSDRCKLIDLGQWFEGGYAIGSDAPSQETQDPEDQDNT